jgi:hypothetical protein
MLTWTPVGGASYYNVQLYLRGRQIFSAWPAGADVQVGRSWRFDGRRYRLEAGRYRWYVWPGFGARTAARYGPLIGRGAFTVAPVA